MQPVDSWVVIVVGGALVVVAALVVLGWVWRTPGAVDNPWIATAAGLAIFVLAVVMWPLYPVLLALALPVALIVLALYVVSRPRSRVP